MEMRSFDGTGRIKFLEISGVPFFDESGKPCGYRGITRDITERKQAEEALRESEEKFYKAFYHSPSLEAITTTDEGRFIEVNDTFCRVTGYSREEMIGRSALELNLWEESKQRKAIIEELKTKETVANTEAKLRTKSGEIRTVAFSMAKIALKNEPRLFSTAIDITERKQAEERINHLNLTLHSIRNVNQLITREKDSDRLIQGVCDNLVKGSSFISAWIVLLDESQKPVAWAAANASSNFPALIELFQQGNFPRCAQKALKQKQVFVTEDPNTMCPGCPISKGDTDIGSMTIRLEIEGIIYGVLCARIAKEPVIR